MTPSQSLSPLHQELLENASWLRRLALSLVRDPNLADDLVQQTMVAALESAPQKSTKQRPWLARILRNKLYVRHRTETRRHSREARVSIEECGELPHDAVERAETGRLITEALLRLEEPFRTTLLMHFHEDKSPKIIARELGINTTTVRTRLHRGLEKLRNELCRTWGKDWANCSPALIAFARTGGTGIVKNSSLLIGAGLLLGTSAILYFYSPWSISSPVQIEEESNAAEVRASDFEPKIAPLEFQPELENRRTPLPESASATATLALGPIKIKGRCVAKEDGSPLPGCQVRFWSGKATEVFAGDDGKFELNFEELPINEQCSITIYCDGRLARRGVWDSDVNPIASHNFGDLQLEHGTMIEGTIRTMDGNPVEKAFLNFDNLVAQSLFDPLESVSISAISDAYGFFRFRSALPKGPRDIRINAKGFKQVKPLFVDVLSEVDRQTIECRVSSMPSIEGQIRYLDGKPAAGARLFARWENSGRFASDLADAEGKFQIFATQENKESIILEIMGKGIQTFSNKESFHWGNHDIVLIAKRTLSQEVLVVEEDSGLPVQDYAIISQVKQETGRRLDSSQKQNSGHHPAGISIVDDLSSGTNLLIVVPIERRFRVSRIMEVEIFEGRNEPIQVMLEAMEPFQIALKNAAGKPVSGSKVLVLDALKKGPLSKEMDLRKDLFHQTPFGFLEVFSQATTDENGLANVLFPPSLMNGGVIIRGEHPELKAELLDPLSQDGPIEFTVMGQCQITGKFIFPESMSGLAGLYFERMDTGRKTLGTPVESLAKPDKDGNYSMDLDPGFYRVHFATPQLAAGQGSDGIGFTVGSGWDAIEPSLGEFEARAGEIIKRDFNALNFEPGSLRGSLTVDGIPQLNAPFSLRLITERGSLRVGGFRTDSEGKFSVNSLMPGNYRLDYRGPDGAGNWDATLQSSNLAVVESGKAENHDFDFHYHSLRLRILHPDTGEPFVNTGWNVTNRGQRFFTDTEGWLTIAPTPNKEFYCGYREDSTSYHVGPLQMDPNSSETELEVRAERSKMD